MIGTPRVFLSAHRPTDVAAGYQPGLSFLTLLIPFCGVCAPAICGADQNAVTPAAG